MTDTADDHREYRRTVRQRDEARNARDDMEQRIRDLIDPADIIGPGECCTLAGGVTRATFRHWRAGRNTRGAGPFPAPFKTVSGVELFDRRAVCAWLEAHQQEAS